MEREIDRIAIGTPFEINQFGARRCPSLAGKTGIVIDCSRYNTGVTVLFDGSKRPTCLHRDYISPTSEWCQDAQRQPAEDNRLEDNRLNGVPKSERRAL
jgi:hypothetical protein